jgi:hypothetical protein
MAKMIKHVGKIKSSDEKVLIAFRTVPGESDYALVIKTKSLEASEHDSIINLVESDQSQEAFEFGEMLSIRPFTDGTIMLVNLHNTGRLVRVPTSDILVTPTTNATETITLSDLNVLIAQQKNCAVDELCNFVSGSPRAEAKEIAQVKDLNEIKDDPVPTVTEQKSNEVLTDRDIARNLRSQADSLYKEAARMRKEADSLDPPQKKTTSKAKETVDA